VTLFSLCGAASQPEEKIKKSEGNPAALQANQTPEDFMAADDSKAFMSQPRQSATLEKG
jgi:hypothetical protein